MYPLITVRTQEDIEIILTFIRSGSDIAYKCENIALLPELERRIKETKAMTRRGSEVKWMR